MRMPLKQAKHPELRVFQVLIGSGILKESEKMRKIILLLTIVFFVAGTSTAYARPRHPHRPYRSHHYHNNGAVIVGILSAIGFGLLVGTAVERANAYPPAAAPAYMPPPVPNPATAHSLVVTAPRLHVRSGPGKHHSVIGEVQLNNVLEIVGSETGWWYVRLYSGQYGWVMSTYTRVFLDPNIRG